MATFGRSRILPPALSCALTLFALAGPSSATAQRRAPDAFTDVARPSLSLFAPPQAASTPSVGHLIVGACLGSVVGLLAGSGIGYALGGEGWDMLGFAGGSVVGSALGVKLAARSDGSRITFVSAVTGSLLGTVAGLAGPLTLGRGGEHPGLAALSFFLAQGTVAGLWGRSHTQR
ncbi:MAG TPA: hypothetical protein VLH75_05850 [Longimicrobiales bacterium]|nr:hypothetical protein [Longimicrobiales bacterium]